MKRLDVEVLEVDPDDIRPMKGQPRIFFDEEEITILKGSLTIRQEQEAHVIRIPEATAKPHFELNDGERRWRAAKRTGHMLRVIVDPPEDTITRFERAFRSNIKVELSPYEKMLGCARLSGEKRYSVAEIAQRVSIKPVTVQLYLQIVRDLHPDMLELLHPKRPPNERLRVMVAYQLSRYNHAEQLRMAPNLLGMGERQANAFIRLRVRGHVQSGTRSRRPSDDYYSFIGTLERTRRDTTHYSSLGTESFERMFGSRELKERKKTLADIHEVITALETIKKFIEELPKSS